MPYKRGTWCGLYHPFEKKVLHIDLPEAGEKVFKGSGHGWVVTTQQDGSISVVNPLSRIIVPLPPRYKFADVVDYRPDLLGKEYHFEYDGMVVPGVPTCPWAVPSMVVRNYKIEKIELSSSPLSTGFRAVALYAITRLAYCKAGGGEEWLDFDDSDARRHYDQITFCGGKLYAMTSYGEMMVCDDIVSCPKLRKCFSIPVYKRLLDTEHLVNTSKGFMMVDRDGKLRVIEDKDGGKSKYTFSTQRFEIFKPDTDLSTWIPMESLGDEILFMCSCVQMGISSNDFGANDGNQIYFSSDRLRFNCEDIGDCFDNGVFNFRDKIKKPLEYECNPRVIWPSPIWVTPNPY